MAKFTRKAKGHFVSFIEIIMHLIDQLHKWRPKKYSFIFMLIRVTSLIGTDKIQKKSSFRTRLAGLITTGQRSVFLAATYAIGLLYAFLGITALLSIFSCMVEREKL